MDQSETRRLLRSNEAAAYLRNQHGLPISDKTWRNKRCAGADAPHKYFGTIPLYATQDLDAFARDALRGQPAKQRAA
jgi:hypothetical protein